MSNTKIRRLEVAIEKTKSQIAVLGELRPGTLSEQYNVCGTPGCHCKATPPQKHGPYYQLSYSLKKKSTTRFVKKEDLARVRKETKDYAKLKKLVERWVELAAELSLGPLGSDALIESCVRKA